MKKIIVTIAVYNRNDDDLVPVVLQNFKSEEEAISAVNGFFEQEAAEGADIHPVVKSLDSLQGARFEDGDRVRIYTLAVTTVEADSSYEAYTRSRLQDYGKNCRTKEEAFAETFLNELNHQPFNATEFATHVCNEHPTLQQYFFRLVKSCILERATNTAYSSDDRNKGSVRMCREIAEAVDLNKCHLPIR